MIPFLLNLATIPAANWMIGHAGTACAADAPCLVPVGFGLMAPSGVLMIGMALVLRDLVHRDLGGRWAAAGVVAGSALSFAIAPPALAIASLVAFAVSESLDQAVYAPLRHRRLVLAVLASGAVGGVADSALFLWLAFGTRDSGMMEQSQGEFRALTDYAAVSSICSGSPRAASIASELLASAMSGTA